MVFSRKTCKDLFKRSVKSKILQRIVYTVFFIIIGLSIKPIDRFYWIENSGRVTISPLLYIFIDVKFNAIFLGTNSTKIDIIIWIAKNM